MSLVFPVPPFPTAAARGLWLCSSCTNVCEKPNLGQTLACPRCGATVTKRKTDSVARTWALVLAAAALYVPANLLPVTYSHSLQNARADTLLSGIAYLYEEGSWALALLVFVASIMVPLFKLLALSYLLLKVQRGTGGVGSMGSARSGLRLYRVLEVIGRWSMLDIYVITMMAALVQMQAVAGVLPGSGAMAFAAVVVLTMLATMSFDPRLLWDNAI